MEVLLVDFAGLLVVGGVGGFVTAGGGVGG